MLLKSLAVHQFRQLEGVIHWGDGLNIIWGDNGQGKTAWLEAIYTLATTKSFRTQKLQDAVRFDSTEAAVRGTVERTSEITRQLAVILQGNTKTILVNDKRAPVAEYLAELHAVAFTADELEVVRGVPDARRRFLDKGVIALYPSYVQTLADYNRVLKQKNKLLRDAQDKALSHAQVAELLAPWNEQLVALSDKMHRARTRYVLRLNEVLERKLFGREELAIRYVSALEGRGDLQHYVELMHERLQLRLTAEIATGYALIGAHRDDLEMHFDGRDLRAFGSSGQQRSALILLDLAAISVYHSQSREYPLFLIDDVDAELDERRISLLLEYLEGRTQTFVTTTKKSLVERFAPRARAVRIAEGRERRDDEDLANA